MSTAASEALRVLPSEDRWVNRTSLLEALLLGADLWYQRGITATLVDPVASGRVLEKELFRYLQVPSTAALEEMVHLSCSHLRAHQRREPP